MLRVFGVDSVHVDDINGYASLATFIASDRDTSTSIFRRFDRLSSRNLLYFQSELTSLEKRQDALDAEIARDINIVTEDVTSVGDWDALIAKSNVVDNNHEKEQVSLALEIREKLKEYRQALVLETALLSVKKPSSRTLAAFKSAFNNESNPKGGYPALSGHSATILDDTEDLMSMKRNEDEDRLTSFLRHCFPVLFLTRRTQTRLAYISERRLHVAVAAINLILAAVLLFGAILNLYYVTDNGKRLGLIAGYTIAFAICVGLVTKARRSEVFAACAAYSAVLVVFVSGNLGSPAVGGSGG